MSNNSILAELQIECPFPEVFEDKEIINGLHSEYRRKIGHIRADYDGYRWWNTVWPCHDALSTPEIAKEIDSVYERLLSKNAFPNLRAMKEFCYTHLKAAANEHTQDEFNFYYTGEHCLFWIRCITRNGDYNLYVHAFIKEEKEN